MPSSGLSEAQKNTDRRLTVGALAQGYSTDLSTLAHGGELNETISGKQFRDARIEVTGNPPCLPSPSMSIVHPTLEPPSAWLA